MFKDISQNANQWDVLFSYSERLRLTYLNLHSVQRRRERYIIIYVWKMLESKVLNFNPPIISLWNERRGRMCVESHVATGQFAVTALDGRQLG